MKTTLIVKRLVQAAVLGTAFVSVAAMAQPGPGAGWGGWCGGGPGMQRGMAGSGGWGMGPGGGRGMGYGMGGGARWGRGSAGSPDTVRGWMLMTPEERTTQQAKMRAVKTYDECRNVQGEHRALMEERARDKGLTLFAPRGNPCDMLKARGLIQ